MQISEDKVEGSIQSLRAEVAYRDFDNKGTLSQMSTTTAEVTEKKKLIMSWMDNAQQ
jgi:hypothetical protein